MPAPVPKWNPQGSEWSRWDPHIHAPGTINNDQFRGDWTAYISAINAADPPIRALGITDYYSLDCYREVCRRHANGELPDVDFIFPNVEIRLDVKTAKGKALNLHLLFSPDEENHEQRIERVLDLFTFEYRQTIHRCNKSGLINLGRSFDPTHISDVGAYREGASQFKISYKELRELLRREKWLRENCLIAVAAGQTDGTSGLQSDDNFAATREEIQRLAHIVFSSKQVDQDYWLGRKEGEPREELEKKYGGLKPCLHGCDAHKIDDVGNPAENRYCWIKGDHAFEALRQVAIEPLERVAIAEAPPQSPAPAVTIAAIELANTPWLKNGSIPLNPGLVAIIGARGSGKTALVDMIAAGANALDSHLSDSSFLARATWPVDLLGDARVTEIWRDGRSFETRFTPGSSPFEAKEVCYLSQQFVDRLCSASGLAVDLRGEIERVIFDQTEKSDRMDTTTFADLSEVLLQPIRHRRWQQSQAIGVLSTKIAAEQRLMDQLDTLRKTQKTTDDRLKAQRLELAKLVPKGKEDRAKRLGELEAAYTSVESRIETLTKRRGALDNLLTDAEYEINHGEPNRFADRQERNVDAGLSETEWSDFRQEFSGNIKQTIAAAKGRVATEIKLVTDGDPAKTVVASASFKEWSLTALKSERDKVKKEVGLDAELQKKYAVLKKSIDNGDTTLKKADTDITHAEGAKKRRDDYLRLRRDTYRDLFQTFVEERDVFARLYEPLHAQLGDATGALARLRFGVKRAVNFEKWVEAGEELLDLRRSSDFQGHGRLASAASAKLLPAWRKGNAEEVASAMHDFVADSMKEMLKAIPTNFANDPAEWRRQLGDWLYSTDHITIEYRLEYDGTNVEQLSPGTRGIVLLLLYLAIDRQDQRPLLIDQPEENLDPNSVFVDLVPHFREARRRRQVVIVTHNANLVVNTDADQVIVASSAPAAAGELPKITYKMGSLENPKIRRAVCDILEGGERAFLERERRYRLQWEQMLEDSVTAAPSVGPKLAT